MKMNSRCNSLRKSSNNRLILKQLIKQRIFLILIKLYLRISVMLKIIIKNNSRKKNKENRKGIIFNSNKKVNKYRRIIVLKNKTQNNWLKMKSIYKNKKTLRILQRILMKISIHSKKKIFKINKNRILLQYKRIEIIWNRM